jgi:FkbM family methyltransferase
MINFFDIGAGTGGVIDKMLNFFNEHEIKDYVIYAFEPQTHRFDVLVKKYADNSKINLYNVACSNFSGNSKLYTASIPGGDSLKDTKYNVDVSKYEIVQVLKFSDWFRNNFTMRGPKKKQYINIVKIDVEGSEYEVYKDIIDNYIVKKIDLFCGSLGDIYKINKTEDEINKFLVMLKNNNIIVHELTAGKSAALVEMERLLQ